MVIKIDVLVSVESMLHIRTYILILVADTLLWMIIVDVLQLKVLQY